MEWWRLQGGEAQGSAEGAIATALEDVDALLCAGIYGQVEFAVAVEILQDDRIAGNIRQQNLARHELTATRASEEMDAKVRSNYHVELSIAVDIAGRDGYGAIHRLRNG